MLRLVRYNARVLRETTIDQLRSEANVADLRPNVVASDGESEDLEVQVGDYIRIGSPPNLDLYIVESIDSNGRVCCKDPTNDSDDSVPLFLSLAEANGWYNKYIRY